LTKMHNLKITDKVAWHKNDGPSKSRGVKMQDTKMQDYFMFSVTAKFLRSNHKLTVQLKLEFKTS